MRQKPQQADMLRVVALQEAISRGYFQLLRARKAGRTSRRVHIFLRGGELPPPELSLGWTVVSSPFGDVKARAWFNQALGRWGITLLFSPPEEGFKVADYVAAT
jgi:hypothetical protein